MSMPNDVLAFVITAIEDTKLPDTNLANLYENLVKEEYQEFIEADSDEEKLDGALDLVWVAIGYCIARGWNVPEAWDEITRTNMAKLQFDPTTGKLKRRADGKILKPDGWKGPELKPFVNGRTTL